MKLIRDKDELLMVLWNMRRSTSEHWEGEALEGAAEVIEECEDGFVQKILEKGEQDA